MRSSASSWRPRLCSRVMPPVCSSPAIAAVNSICANSCSAGSGCGRGDAHRAAPLVFDTEESHAEYESGPVPCPLLQGFGGQLFDRSVNVGGVAVRINRGRMRELRRVANHRVGKLGIDRAIRRVLRARTDGSACSASDIAARRSPDITNCRSRDIHAAPARITIVPSTTLGHGGCSTGRNDAVSSWRDRDAVRSSSGLRT
jgi:hypothetical protein